ncbi:MAG: right-handed parallel beta-helix repeat-containing protein [Holophaga sp.]
MAHALPKLTAWVALSCLLALAAVSQTTCGGGGPGVAVASGPPASSPPSQPSPPPATTDPCSPTPAGPVANVQDAPYGARGDGASDDTAAIQMAVNAVARTGGTVLVPAGTYMVDAVTSVMLKGNMTFQMAEGAVLKAIPNGVGNYSILTVYQAADVTIMGGTLVGDYGNPVTHTGTTGEWGMGLSLSGASNVTVVGVTARDCWGDGFYLENGCSGVTLCSLNAVHNRRNGLTVTSAVLVTVNDSVFTGSGGTLPEDGLDLEPNPGETVDQVTISGCTMSGNAGDGVADGVDLANTGTAFITRVTLSGNTITGNGANSLDSDPRSGIEVSNVTGHLISGNTVDANTGNGILLRDRATGLTVTGNTIEGNSLHGLWDQVGGNATGGNVVSGNGLSP